MLLTLNAGNYYIQMAEEKNKERSLRRIGNHLRPDRRIYVGVIDTVNETVESVDEVYVTVF